MPPIRAPPGDGPVEGAPSPLGNGRARDSESHRGGRKEALVKLPPQGRHRTTASPFPLADTPPGYVEDFEHWLTEEPHSFVMPERFKQKAEPRQPTVNPRSIVRAGAIVGGYDIVAPAKGRQRWVVRCRGCNVEFERAAHAAESADDRRNLDMLELDAGHRLETGQAGRHRFRHRPEMDRDVLGLGQHCPPGGEQGSRAICPLLDVGRQ